MRTGLRWAMAILLASAPCAGQAATPPACQPQVQAAPASCCGSTCTCGPKAACICTAPERPAAPANAAGTGVAAPGVIHLNAPDWAVHPAAVPAPHRVCMPASSHPATCKLSTHILELFCTRLV